jgi:transglutaminase-like putative cysteine protease
MSTHSSPKPIRSIQPLRGWQGAWALLSREQQDTLFLLAVIALVVVPHFEHLPVWAVALSTAVLLWRAWLTVKLKPLPRRWALIVLLVACVAGTWLTFRTIAGRDAGVTLLLMLLALKTLELKARRDAMVIFFLGFFAVLTHFLFSQSLLSAALMIAAVVGLLAALIGAHMPVGWPSIASRLRLAGRMLLLGTPLAAALFAFFPRMAGPLWGMPDQRGATTGLSDSMSVGNIAELALNDAVAMSVRFDGAAPNPNQLYFRGPVLSRFDGITWTPFVTGFAARAQSGADIRIQGPAVNYEVTLEPVQRPWLFGIEVMNEAPALANQTVILTRAQQLITSRAVNERVQYRMQSYPQAQIGPFQESNTLREYIALPASYNPRTLAYAMELRRDPRFASADATTLSRHLLSEIRRQPFTYTLAPGLYGRDSVDEFWFDRREGFCEHFAQAYVVLMRALDVPARVVTGYQGAELNAFDGSYTVRQSHAHAWAEYWQEGMGWVRADPTAAVAPERINNLSNLNAQRGLFGVAILAPINATWLQRARQAWDAINNSWNKWVLSYNSTRQLDLLKELGIEDPDWQKLASLLLLAAAGALLLGAAWAMWDRQAWLARRDPWMRLYRAGAAHLSRHGIKVLANDAPRTLGHKSLTLAHGEQWQQWWLTLERLRYAPAEASTDSDASYSRLKQILKQLCKSPDRPS